MRGRVDPVVLAAFLLTVLVGGTNFVAVRFSNRELDPFWGAGLRFALAATLLLGLVAAQRIPLPRRDALPITALYGVLTFGLVYGLLYWALLEAPAALGAIALALVPLLTFVIAVLLGMERFTWQRLAGGTVAFAGITVVFADQIATAVSPLTMLALLGSAVAAAASAVVAKRIPRSHPVATNAVAMVPGAVLLLVLAALVGDRAALPAAVEVQVAFVYLVVSTLALFIGFFFVVQRWTASATMYAAVLWPLVAVALGFVLAGESVSLAFVLGTLLVMSGVYVSTLTPATAAVATRAPANGTSSGTRFP